MLAVFLRPRGHLRGLRDIKLLLVLLLGVLGKSFTSIVGPKGGGHLYVRCAAGSKETSQASSMHHSVNLGG